MAVPKHCGYKEEREAASMASMASMASTLRGTVYLLWSKASVEGLSLLNVSLCSSKPELADLKPYGHLLSTKIYCFLL